MNAKPQIENPNSSGQGYHAEHLLAPAEAREILAKRGWTYSHSTPVWHGMGAAPGEWRLHHTWRRGQHAVSLRRTGYGWRCEAHWLGSPTKSKPLIPMWIDGVAGNRLWTHLQRVESYGRSKGFEGFER